MEDHLKKLKSKYDLQHRLAGMEAEKAELSEALKLAVYKKREQETIIQEYQGSLRSVLHSLCGKRVQVEEQMAREAKAARDCLDGVQWKIADLERKQNAAREDLALLADVAEVPGDPNCAAIRADYLLKTILPLLSQCQQALEQSLAIMRSDIHSEKERGTAFTYQSRANDLAQEICRQLEALNVLLAMCGIAGVEPTAYLRNPAGYLVTAAQFGGLNKGNQAIGQLTATRKRLAELKRPLAEFLPR